MGRLIRAIPTQYKTTLYRSRCEARWAVFWDNIGWKHIFEPEGFDLGEFGYYLPDFWLEHPIEYLGQELGWGFWAEIKPNTASQEELDKLLAVCEATRHNGYMIQGYPERSYTVDKIQIWHVEKPEIRKDVPARWRSNRLYEYARHCAGSTRFEHLEG